MRQLIYLFILLFISLAANPQISQAVQVNNAMLVTINAQSYSSEEFEHWWEIWKEKDDPFPENLEEFIGWQLLVEQAKSMDLDTTPAYIRKVEVFLKVRSLVLLKDEEVLSKIDIQDSEIKKFYNSEYLPIWKLNILYFDDKNVAATAYDDSISDKKSFAEIAENREVERGSIRLTKRIFRPSAFINRQNWLDEVSKLKKGEITPVLKDGDRFVIFQVEDINTPDENDYENVKELIKKKIIKEKQNELTIALVEKLRNKFDVTINEEIFAKLGQEDFPEEWLDEPIITTNRSGDRSTILAKVFVQQLKNEEKLRTRKAMTTEAMEQVKQNMLDGLIAEVVLGWESLERHYEEREPFKQVYEFYKKNRLKVALEERLLSGMDDIDEEQVAAFYDNNIESYTKPEMVKIGSVETDLKTAKKIWLAILQGESLFNVAEKGFGLEIKIQEMPKKHLAPEIQQEIDRLAAGDVSSPVEVKEKAYIIKLIDRKEKQKIPLDSVKGEIQLKLTTEKFGQIRAEFVQKLKEHSTISINQQEWESIHKEHRGENEI